MDILGRTFIWYWCLFKTLKYISNPHFFYIFWCKGFHLKYKKLRKLQNWRWFDLRLQFLILQKCDRNKKLCYIFMECGRSIFFVRLYSLLNGMSLAVDLNERPLLDYAWLDSNCFMNQINIKALSIGGFQ